MKNTDTPTNMPGFMKQPGNPAGGKPTMISPAPGGGKTTKVKGGGGMPLSRGTR